MRLTKLMAIAVVVAGLGVALNALAFKTASVTNAASFTVESTDSAALAIEAAAVPGVDTGFSTSGLSTGSMTLTINDKMQPNSTYTFSNVFMITNKASNTTTAITGVGYSDTASASVADVTLYVAGTSTELTNETLASGASVAVDMEITVEDNAALGAESFDIIIFGNQ